MKPIHLALLLSVAAASLIAAKPSAGPADPKIAYVILTGPGFELRVTNQDGTGATTLFKSPNPLRFDLGPRGQQVIALTDGNALKLLHYQVNGTGSFQTQSVETVYTDATRLYYVDMSPDGSKIAFAARNGEDLMVYDLSQPAGPANPATWVTVPYVWDHAWYKGGAAIAYVVPKTATGHAVDELYEISGPGAAPSLIHTGQEIDFVDAARTNTDALVLTYRVSPQSMLVGLWANGQFLQPNLTNRAFSFRGTLSCDDRYLVYAAPDKSGSTVWYIRDLNQNSERLYSKAPRVNWTQMWPTCS